MNKPPGSELQKQTLWLYGVLVGLAIEGAVTSVYQHVAQGQEFSEGGWLTAIRLFIFLMVIVRFYLGAVQYFYAVYRAPTADTEFPTKSFRLDFLLGLVHFTIFCILGLSATYPGGWLFPFLLAFVLSYDLGWYWGSRSLSTRHAIGPWMVINLATVVVSVLFYWVAAFLFMWFANQRQMTLAGQQFAFCELAAYVPVLLASMVDLGSLLHHQSSTEKWIVRSVAKLLHINPAALGDEP